MHKKWFKKHPWHVINQSSSTKWKSPYKIERMKLTKPRVPQVVHVTPDIGGLAITEDFR